MMRTESAEEAARLLRLAEAAAWRTRLTEESIDSSSAFEAWLATHEDNRRAWSQVQGPWELFGEQAHSPELIELRRAALGRARDAGRHRWLRSSGGRMRLLAAAAMAVVMIAGFLTWHAGRPDIYRTQVGERRVVTLTDGSKIALDSQTEVRVSYSQEARDLSLLSGQARFDVAKDVQRPFAVYAAGRKVVATGTAFNVDLIGSEALITLIEGHVVIFTDADESVRKETVALSERPRPVRRDQTIELAAGEQLVLAAGTAPTVTTANVEQTTAWQSGRLVFENEPLASVIERMNRYSARALRIADPRAAELRMSGVFNTGDVESFVATVTAYLPVRAENLRSGDILLRHR
ncbi:FecR family protein [Peristeroidobacter soli]|jgi:transmembrane sensor|uniref:FecR family protein n=1 Tax=Peristeroidobacter soli TaxID=2497877 RepID=UPI00158D0C04|nr:FecR domain-containing protein [Peristeroidobacter soli]